MDVRESPARPAGGAVEARDGRPERRTGPAAGLRLFAVPLLIAGLILALAFAESMPRPPGLSVQAFQAGLLVVFTIGSWALDLLPEPLTTLLFFLLVVLFHVTPPGTVFSGFETPTWWLVFGGTVTGLAIRSTGLGTYAGRLLFRRPASYGGCVTITVLAAVGLAFLMPSTSGRILLLTPIALALADRLGFEQGRPGRTGLVLAVAAASYMPPTTILPANVPNTILLGAAETLYGIRIQYGPYLLLHFPMLGALKSVVIIALIRRLFPDRIDGRGAAETEGQALSGGARRLVLVLVVALLLYATDAWHGISPAWISLGAGMLCLLPQMGILSPKQFNEGLQITPLIYVAGFLGLSAVIAQSGLGGWAGHELLRLVPMAPDQPVPNLLRLAGIDAAIGALTTLPGLPAVLAPLARDFAQASGLTLYMVLMLQVPVFSTVFLPYQSPPMMIGMQLGKVSLRDASKLCLAVAAVTVLVLLPLDLLWWRLVLGF